MHARRLGGAVIHYHTTLPHLSACVESSFFSNVSRQSSLKVRCMEIIRHVCLFACTGTCMWRKHVRNVSRSEQSFAFCQCTHCGNAAAERIQLFLSGGWFQIFAFLSPKNAVSLCKWKALPIKYFVIFTHKCPRVNRVLVCFQGWGRGRVKF